MKWTNKGHQFDNIGNYFQKRKSIYIYGAGYCGKSCYELVKFTGSVEAFIDRSIDKQRSKFCGLPVLSPTCVLNQYNETHYILIAANQSNTQESLNTQSCKCQ